MRSPVESVKPAPSHAAHPMLEAYLELLLAVQEGEQDLASLAHAAGLDESDTAHALEALHANGFLGTAVAGHHALLPAGRTLLRIGADEIFKRLLHERLGGHPQSAS